MPNFPLILCVGYDARLLDSRSKVLATRYNVEYISLRQGESLRLPSHNFDLLVLCHTLPTEHAMRVADWFHAQWPHALVVRMFTSGPAAVPMRADLAVDATDGPARLLTQINGLLSRESSVSMAG